MRKPFSSIILVLLLALVDQSSKLFVFKYSKGGIIINKNGVFGIFPWYLAVIGIMIVMLWLFWSKKWLLGLLMMFAGGASNIVDRLVWGGVVDFIQIWRFPIFNLADIMICIGAVYQFWELAYSAVLPTRCSQDSTA